MSNELISEPSNWGKERQKDTKILKQMKGQDITINNLQKLIGQNEQLAASQRNYKQIYMNIQLKYKMIAGKIYLRDPKDMQCFDYSYLAGLSGIYAYLFNSTEKVEENDLTEMQNKVNDFTLALLQLYSTNFQFPESIKNIDHLYVQLLQGNFSKANELLVQTKNEFDPQKPSDLWISERERLAIQSILQNDSQRLNAALTQYIRNYRKSPLGYTTYIDYYSIAFIKLAHKYNMQCDLNIIEIPAFFLSSEPCIVDTSTLQLLFQEDAITELKTRGVHLSH